MSKRDLSTAAAILGSSGGKANTAKQAAARSRNGRHGGRKPLYRLTHDGLQKRHGETWLDLEPPFDDAAKAFLRRSK